MRLIKRLRLPSVNGLTTGLATQAAGVVVDQVATRFVPNIWGKWAVAVVAAGMGMWYPITRMTLEATGLDERIAAIGKD